MDKVKVKYRYHKALSCLCDLLKDDLFADNLDDSGKYIYRNHFHAISLLVNGYEYYGDQKFKSIYKKLLDNIDKQLFTKSNALVFIHDDQFFNIWNAWLSIIMYKIMDIDRSTLLIKMLLESFNENSVNNVNTNVLGEFLISLLLLQNYDEYENTIFLLTDRITKHISYNPADIWSIKFLLNSNEPLWSIRLLNKNKEIVKCLDKHLMHFSKLSVRVTTSLVAGLIQEVYLTNDRVSEEVFEHQSNLQTYNGHFRRNLKSEETRLDYLLSNISALEKTLKFLECGRIRATDF